MDDHDDDPLFGLDTERLAPPEAAPVPSAREGDRRLAKVMAERGVASRREAEKMIADGRVFVNGVRVSHPGHPVDPRRDTIRLDGKALPRAAPKLWFILYKPKGFITGRDDPEGRPSVLSLLPDVREKVEPVGRLDFNTEGVLLLTNDGEVAHKLTHPSTQVPKRYLVKCWKTPDERALARLQAGVDLDDGRTLPCKARVMSTTDASNAWIEVTVTEGRNRLVRRAFATLGHPVSKLRRVSFATISLRGLERGQYRALTSEEVARLHDVASGVAPQEAGHADQKKKVGFARPNRAWLEKRLDRQRRKDKRKLLPRGGAAR